MMVVLTEGPLGGPGIRPDFDGSLAHFRPKFDVLTRFPLVGPDITADFDGFDGGPPQGSNALLTVF